LQYKTLAPAAFLHRGGTLPKVGSVRAKARSGGEQFGLQWKFVWLFVISLPRASKRVYGVISYLLEARPHYPVIFYDSFFSDSPLSSYPLLAL
jgi:hypothetical protein